MAVIIYLSSRISTECFPATSPPECDGFCDPETSADEDANFSNRSLVSDWDVLVTIHHSLVSSPFPLQLQHVRGHQENLIPYTLLPLLERLSVGADRLVGQYQDVHGSPLPTIL